MEPGGGEEAPSSDSFWEVDCFKRTVRRAEDGMTMCNELVKLMQERAELEKDYARHLKEWSKKWRLSIEKGPEYGTNRETLLGVLAEADSMADIHTGVKDTLLNINAARVKEWRNENYKKTIVGVCKVARNFEDEFKKAQKPWAKQLGKVQKAKKEYHTACKLERTAVVQEANSRGASDVSQDQSIKLREKADKCRKDTEQTRDRYEQTLKDLKTLTPRYMEDMSAVFKTTQDFEERRLRFFKKTLYDLVGVLDLSQNHAVSEVYKQMRQTVDQSNAEADLKWWANTHGDGMAMAWPVFEEYSAELNPIGRKTKGVYASGEVGGITAASASFGQSTAGPPPAYTAPPNAAAAVAPPVYAPWGGEGATVVAAAPVIREPHPADRARPVTNLDPSMGGSMGGSRGSNPNLAASARGTVGGGSVRASEPVPRGATEAHGPPVQQRGAEASRAPPLAAPAGSNPFGDDFDEDENDFPADHHDNDASSADRHSDAGSQASQHSTQAAPAGAVAIGYEEGNREHSEINGREEAAGRGEGEASRGAEAGEMLGGGRGVPVRALFDYEGVDVDELSFKSGDVFVKLKDEDEQGWCTGRVNGRVGLYPANYVQPC